MKKRTHLLILPLLALLSCSPSEKEKNTTKTIQKEIDKAYAKDVHSAAQPNSAVVKHLDLNIAVSFDKKEISGTASYQFEANKGAKEIILDAKDLIIEKVSLNKQKTPTTFRLEKVDAVHGQALHISLEGNQDNTLSIQYKTTASSEALQWLSPQQTADKKEPFLFTQGQAILTRTWIPIQDSPQVRITYTAQVQVPNQMMAVMSAENPKAKNDTGTYVLKMKQAIPAYLIALAVGDIEYKPISARTGIYAEKSMLDKAHTEFSEMENMVQAAEQLYGKYAWDQFDVIVLPPSFPFGGMENPRLTFATPTVIAGDKSLTTLIAHELAHSWSGNLVTNATWDDFWLNEGFTVYFEMRIMESLYGKEYADMLASIGRQDLEEELENLHEHPKDTHLKLNLEGRNPDDGMNSIAYDKGYLFLRTLETKIGREKMDTFLQGYFTKNAFTSMSTTKFISYLEALLQETQVSFDYKKWIYGPGIPDGAIRVVSDKFAQVDEAMQQWLDGKVAAKALCAKEWNVQQKVHFVRSIPEKVTLAQMQNLDKACDFTNSGNSFIAMEWYRQAILHHYHDNGVDQKIEGFLEEVGRRWYVTTLFKAFVKAERKEEAKKIYKKTRGNYHSVTANTVDEILK